LMCNDDAGDIFSTVLPFFSIERFFLPGFFSFPKNQKKIRNSRVSE
jgi:hypothetical protein